MNKIIIPSNRVVIIGAGNVGASIAYSILNQKISAQILFIDIIKEFASTQAADMEDSSAFVEGIEIKNVNYSEIRDGDIIIITSGTAQKEGQTRLDLTEVNKAIIKSVIKNIKQQNKLNYILIVANPVDLLTYFAIKEIDLPEGLVFGSGTYLDSGRLRLELAKEFNINPKDIIAYILGEHGDSSFPALNSVSIGGTYLSNIKNIDEKYYNEISDKIRKRAYEIIQGKKATYYGIGTAIASICKSIIFNENRIFPVSTLVNNHYGIKDVAIGLPALVNNQGAKITFELKLNDIERNMLRKSVELLKSLIN